MRIVFLGTGAIGVPALEALNGVHEVCGVVTQPDRPAGRAMRLQPSPVKEAALRMGLPVFQPEKIRSAEALETLAAWQADVFVVAAYGQILPRSVLDLPRLACLNIHASLLPRHRGASPIQAAILAGDRETGITIMGMDEGLDTGDIWHKESLEIGKRETAGELHDRLAELAPGVLLRALELLERGEVRRIRQEDSLATYAPKLARKDGEIDWCAPAAEIDRQIRGLTPWPGAYAFLPVQPPVLLKIHAAIPEEKSGEPGVVLETGEGILVAAGEGSMLLQEVQIAGGKRLKAKDFLRGFRLEAGTCLLGKSRKNSP